jgi:hypothetical protein
VLLHREIEFEGMDNFSCVVSNEVGKLVFNFLKVFTTKGVRYIVTTTMRSRAYSFYMKPEHPNWVIVEHEKLPPDILEIESQLSKAVNERLKE